MKKVIINLCSGLVGVILTLGYQHFFAPDPSFIFYINGKKVEVNEIDYTELISQNQSLQDELDELGEEYKKLEAETESLADENLKNISELNAMPIFSYSNLSLSIDGEDIPINKNNAMITIDGRDYFSREITESLISDNKSFTIKDGTLFIGKIIVEKSSLIDEVIVHSGNILITNRIKDSYGNFHTNALYPQNYHSYMIVNLNRKFSYLKFKLAVQENGYSDAIVTIMADDTIVYTSPSLTITTEPFDVIDIPINNCSLLTIKIDSGPDRGMGLGFDCIVSDPIVYN